MIDLKLFHLNCADGNKKILKENFTKVLFQFVILNSLFERWKRLQNDGIGCMIDLKLFHLNCADGNKKILKENFTKVLFSIG